MTPRRCLFAIVILALAACDRRDDGHLRVEVNQLVNSEGAMASAAMARLVPYGSRALPLMEAALHTAKPGGRVNLVVAMRRLGEAEAIPLLLHIAAYDSDETVRHEAEWALRGFARGEDARAARAKDAMRKLDEIRGSEEAG